MQETPVRFLGPEDLLEKGQATHSSILGLPFLVKNPPTMRETWVLSLGWKDPLEKGKATHSCILAGEFHGMYSPLVMGSQRVGQDWATMAPHSSTLAWKIPRTEEPGRLQSMGSRRGGHNWVTSLSLFTFMHWRRKWQPTPVFLPEDSQGRRSLVGCRLWGCTELDTTEAT